VTSGGGLRIAERSDLGGGFVGLFEESDPCLFIDVADVSGQVEVRAQFADGAFAIDRN